MHLKRVEKGSNFLLATFILFNIIIEVSCQISLLKYYEAQHALAHVIKKVKTNQLQQIEDTYQQQCTKSNECCLCMKNFKNSTYLQLHMSIHHPLTHQKPQDILLTQIFDKKINHQYRFETCLKILDHIDVKQILKRDIQNWSQNNQQERQFYQNNSINDVNLNKTQIVDVCTIVAFGAYHQPVWIYWLKGTVIFIFAIIFLVYYASLFDEISAFYFPKKDKKNRLKSKLNFSN